MFVNQREPNDLGWGLLQFKRNCLKLYLLFIQVLKI